MSGRHKTRHCRPEGKHGTRNRSIKSEVGCLGGDWWSGPYSNPFGTMGYKKQMIPVPKDMEMEAIADQIKIWSSKCSMECPLGQLLKDVLQLYEHCKKEDGRGF